jgi:hypothetical protein
VGYCGSRLRDMERLEDIPHCKEELPEELPQVLVLNGTKTMYNIESRKAYNEEN